MTHTISIKQLLLLVGTLFLSVLIPGNAEAYFTTDQSAVKVGNSALLFTIDYVFGNQNYDIEMPALASKTIEAGTDFVSFEIYDDSDPEAYDLVPGTAYALVLSNAPLTDSAMYHLKKGASYTMKLIVLFIPDSPESGDKFALQVENLPFTLDDNQNKLNEPELRPYTTELISW